MEDDDKSRRGKFRTLCFIVYFIFIEVCIHIFNKEQLALGFSWHVDLKCFGGGGSHTTSSSLTIAKSSSGQGLSSQSAKESSYAEFIG